LQKLRVFVSPLSFSLHVLSWLTVIVYFVHHL
jgi:hypothetical protein